VEPLPFEGDLIRSITDDIIAHALIDAPRNADSPWLEGKYEGFEKRNGDSWNRLLIGREHFTLRNASLLAAGGIEFIVSIIGYDRKIKLQERIAARFPDNTVGIAYVRGELGVGYDYQRKSHALLRAFEGYRDLPPLALKDKYVRIINGKELLSIFKGEMTNEFRKAAEQLSRVTAEGAWVIIEQNMRIPAWATGLVKSKILDDVPVVITIRPVAGPLGSDVLAERWMEVIDTWKIPPRRPDRAPLIARAERIIPEILEARREAAQVARQRAKKSK
jgi:hypothetical protein